MVVGIVRFELHLPGAQSLKDKRQVVRSLKQRLRERVHASVAEVEYQDLWQRSAIAVVTVSSDHDNAEQVLAGAEQEATAMLGGALIVASVEWLA